MLRRNQKDHRVSLFGRLIAKRSKTIFVHVLDLADGYTTQEWAVGTDVEEEDARRFSVDGELYVIKPAKVGQKPAGFVSREVWKSAKADLDEKDNEFLSRPRFFTGDPAKDAQYNYGSSSGQPAIAQSDREEIGEKLFTQAIGTQSVWYGKVFKRGLDLEDAEINALEITFFTLSTLQIAYLNFGSGGDEEKMDLLGEVSVGVFYQSARSLGSANIDLGAVIPNFQARFREYYKPTLELMRSKKDADDFDILLSIFRNVTGREPNSGEIVRLAFYRSMVYQTIADQIEFVKDSLN